jgi:hypothetical protein
MPRAPAPYRHALREPERWALLTRACLERCPVERTGEPGPPPAERFDELALAQLLHPATDAGSVLITGVVRASDMLCALWLARRSGLFHPGMASRGWVGSRSRLGLVPAFAPASLSHAAYTLATLYANAAYKRHLAARGERAAGGAADRGHRRAGAPRTPGPLVGRGAVRLGSAHQALSAPAYWSEPGVVSFSPVSSSVFRPESTIGQPP